MKKSLLVFSLFLLCSILLFSVSAGEISRSENAVTVTSQTLYGDPTAAEGITVTERTNLRSHLLWETEFAASDPENAKTDFSFHVNALTFPDQTRPMIQFMFFLNGGIGSTGDILADVDETSGMDRGFPILPAIELADQTAPGETKTARFVLADYYEEIPYSLDFLFGGDYTTVYDENFKQQVRDYFHFKTSKDLVIELELTKDDAGRTTDINYSCEEENAGLDTVCTTSGDGFYFAFSLASDLDFSEVPGGFGIYYLPVSKEESDGRTILSPLASQLDTIYPLDQTRCEVLDLQYLRDQNALALFTLEQEHCWLNLISLTDYHLIQRLEVAGEYEDGLYYPIQADGDYLLVCGSYDSFTLLGKKSDGTYFNALTGGLTLPDPTQEDQMIYLYGYESELAYDGERLAIATFSSQYDLSSFYLAVYDKSGLVYAGSYLHSQDSLNASVDHRNRCLPVEQDALTLNFS